MSWNVELVDKHGRFVRSEHATQRTLCAMPVNFGLKVTLSGLSAAPARWSRGKR